MQTHRLTGQNMLEHDVHVGDEGSPAARSGVGGVGDVPGFSGAMEWIGMGIKYSCSCIAPEEREMLGYRGGKWKMENIEGMEGEEEEEEEKKRER